MQIYQYHKPLENQYHIEMGDEKINVSLDVLLEPLKFDLYADTSAILVTQEFVNCILCGGKNYDFIIRYDVAMLQCYKKTQIVCFRYL